MYVYQAEVWCDACGADIRAALKKARKAPADPRDERSYDSDDYPKCAPEGDSDSPQHCGGHHDCLSRVDLATYASKRGAKLVRTLEDRLRYVGAPLEELTYEGAIYTRECIAEMRAPYMLADPLNTHAIKARQRALANLWEEIWGSSL